MAQPLSKIILHHVLRTRDRARLILPEFNSDLYRLDGRLRRPFRAAEFDAAIQPGPTARAVMPCAFSASKSNPVYLSGYPTKKTIAKYKKIPYISIRNISFRYMGRLL
jgi:hypothetical protein